MDVLSVNATIHSMLFTFVVIWQLSKKVLPSTVNVSENFAINIIWNRPLCSRLDGDCAVVTAIKVSSYPTFCLRYNSIGGIEVYIEFRVGTIKSD